MTDVQGRTAFITGGANGIGLGIARSLARAGVKLALADIDAEALARAKAELGAVTVVETYVLDVRDRQAYAAAADAAESALGPVSLLFNNAGIAGSIPAHRITYDQWDWALGINLNGPINGVQTFLPRMMERGQGGHIVNTASGAGLVAAGSGLMYTTTKFGVVGLSEALNLELQSAGIGVSVLCPGPVATDIVRRSAEALPTQGMTLSPEQQAAGDQRRAMATQFLAQGVPIDTVGDMVLDAIRNNRFYILTDRLVADAIKARTEAMLGALPAEPALAWAGQAS